MLRRTFSLFFFGFQNHSLLSKSFTAKSFTRTFFPALDLVLHSAVAHFELSRPAQLAHCGAQPYY